MMTYDERLQHLLATAANIFAAHGFHSTTMRDLSRATGMSLAGMYYYVEGKDELLFLIQERCFTEILTGARAAIAAETYPLERLRRFIRHHVGFFTAHMAEMKVLSHEAESLSGERWETINRLKRTYVDLLLSVLDGARPEGDSSIDARVAAFALFGMMNWIYTWYDPEGSVPPDRLADQLAELFMLGLVPSTTPAAQQG
jgi:AcrR family transcriptional regulator